MANSMMCHTMVTVFFGKEKGVISVLQTRNNNIISYMYQCLLCNPCDGLLWKNGKKPYFWVNLYPLLLCCQEDYVFFFPRRYNGCKSTFVKRFRISTTNITINRC